MSKRMNRVWILLAVFVFMTGVYVIGNAYLASRQEQKDTALGLLNWTIAELHPVDAGTVRILLTPTDIIRMSFLRVNPQKSVAGQSYFGLGDGMSYKDISSHRWEGTSIIKKIEADGVTFYVETEGGGPRRVPISASVKMGWK